MVPGKSWRLRTAGIRREPPTFALSSATAIAICFAMKRPRTSGASPAIEQAVAGQFPVSRPPEVCHTSQCKRGYGKFGGLVMGSRLVVRKSKTDEMDPYRDLVSLVSLFSAS